MCSTQLLRILLAAADWASSGSIETELTHHGFSVERVTDQQTLIDKVIRIRRLRWQFLCRGNLLYHHCAARRMVGLDKDADLSAMCISDMHPDWALKRIVTEGCWRKADDRHDAGAGGKAKRSSSGYNAIMWPSVGYFSRDRIVRTDDKSIDSRRPFHFEARR